jgi:hypothetical protein
MEIFGGFMVMVSILGFFLAIVWLIMPFVVFTIKGKLDRTLDVLAGIEKRLDAIEKRLTDVPNGQGGDEVEETARQSEIPSSAELPGTPGAPVA